MVSIWEKTTKIQQRPTLTENISIPVAIIGGGLAGLLTAYFLQAKGQKVIVLEANRIGSGQTKNTTAKITSQHGLIYHKLIQTFNEETALHYAQANQKAILEYQRIIEENNISCQFTKCAAFLYSTEQEEPLHQEAQAASHLGIQAEFTTDTELPFPVCGAVKFSHQARFHPLHFLQEVAKNITVYENTSVQKVQDHTIITNRGTVTAEKIIFTTHYPFINMPGYFFARMHQERSYVLALENVPLLNDMYLGIDEDGLSFRSNEPYLLFGGGNHRTGENSAGGKYEILRQKAQQYWPKGKEVAYWSAQDCMPIDGIPYIGQFSASTPNWYIATGFQKWGMTSSMVAAMILSDSVFGQENPFAATFSPQRFDISASTVNLLKDSMQAIKGLSKEIFAIPQTKIEELPKGHGGIVEHNGQKVGIYKNMQGEVFQVSVRCPHLGCQLEWNPDELSWDCPCHGSRFDYKGQLINNPAQENLPYHPEFI